MEKEMDVDFAMSLEKLWVIELAPAWDEEKVLVLLDQLSGRKLENPMTVVNQSYKDPQPLLFQRGVCLLKIYCQGDGHKLLFALCVPHRDSSESNDPPQYPERLLLLCFLPRTP